MPSRSQQAQRLAQLVDNFIMSARHIERQRMLMQRLKDENEDTEEARRTLVLMEELHSIYREDKDRLIRGLAQEPEASEKS